MKYRLNIKKVSGVMKNSALPKKSLVIESRTKKSKKSIVNECSKYLKKNYGLKLESFEVEQIDVEEPSMNGFIFCKYNSQWDHFSLAWESETGEIKCDDEEDLNEIIWKFKPPYDNSSYFVKEIEKALKDGVCRYGARFVIENGEVVDVDYDY